jgi:hypothetical protein
MLYLDANGCGAMVIKVDTILRDVFGYGDDRRLRAKRRKRLARSLDHATPDGYEDAIVISLELMGPPGDRCDVAEVPLLANDQAEEALQVGDVQDVNPGYASTVSLATREWSSPRYEEGHWFRSVTVARGRTSARGELVFYSYGLLPETTGTASATGSCAGRGFSLPDTPRQLVAD